jgi:cobalt-zinc-cadmium efflux system protein
MAAHQHGGIPGHDHAHDADLRRLGITLGLVLVYMVAEVVGGLLTGSLALLADAGHMLSDAGSLGLALFALRIARRPRTPERTFGYHRTEILAALVNGAALVAIAVFIVVEAWHRFAAPQAVDGETMMWIAVGGLGVNLTGVWVLHGSREASLNLRGAWLHVLADTLGSVQAIAAGALIWAFGWWWADPAASVLIASLVVWSSWTLLRDSVNVLMESTPPHLDAEAVEAAIAGVEGVEEVHDLHIWTITTGFESLSVHARVAGRSWDEVLREVRSVVRERFGIAHSTIQLEGEAGCLNDRCAEG